VTRALAIAALACAACTTPATAIVVIVDAEPPVAAATASLRIEVRGAARGAAFGTDTQIFPVASPHYPVRVTVAPRDGDTSRRVDIVVTALSGAGARVVDEEVISDFAPGRVASLHVVLTDCCVHTTCPAMQTCRPSGASCGCVDPAIDITMLPDYDAGAPPDAGSRDGGFDGPATDAPGTDAPGTDAPPPDFGLDGGVDLGPLPDLGPGPCPATCSYPLSWQQSATALPGSVSPGALSVADMIHDHTRDAVLLATPDFELLPLERTGCLPTSLIAGGAVISGSMSAVAFGDLDRDGWDDALLVGDTGVHRELGAAGAVVDLGTASFVGGDATTTKTSALLSPDGTTLYVGTGASEVLVADTPFTSSTVTVRNHLTGAPDAPTRLALGRRFGGNVVLSVGARGDVWAYYGTATSMLALSIGGPATSLLAVDFDGDMSDEIVATTPVGPEFMIQSEGLAILELIQVVTGLGALDVDGDDIPELVYVDGSTASVHVTSITIDGTGIHSTPRSPIGVTGAATLTELVVADVDRDGLLDIVLVGTLSATDAPAIFVLTASC
jgi:hypothetical protein